MNLVVVDPEVASKHLQEVRYRAMMRVLTDAQDVEDARQLLCAMGFDPFRDRMVGVDLSQRCDIETLAQAWAAPEMIRGELKESIPSKAPKGEFTTDPRSWN